MLSFLLVGIIGLFSTCDQPQQNNEEDPAKTGTDTLAEGSERDYTYEYQPKKISFAEKREEFYDAFKKEEQSFTISPQKESLITCKEGTQLKIKSNSFVDQKGNLVTTTIVVKVTEYYKYTDMILGDLTTFSDGNLLESGGMLNITAYANGEEIRLKQGMEMGVKFANTQDYKMDLYNGVTMEDGSVNWKRDTKAKSGTPVICCANGKYREAVVDFFMDNYTFSRRDMISLLDARWTIGVSLDKNGEIIGTTDMESDALIPGRVQGVCNQKFFEIMKRFKDEVPEVPLPMKGAKFVFHVLSSKEYINDYGFFYTMRLGNLNKDYFEKYKQPKINFVVDSDLDGETEYKLIFKDFKGIANGKEQNNKYVFKNVPIGLPVLLVRIRYAEDKVYVGFQDTFISKDFENKMEYKEYQNDQLKDIVSDLVAVI